MPIKKEVIHINNNIKLYLGNSNELIKDIPDNSVDLIVIDPPYLLNMSGGKKGTSDIAKTLLSLEKELTEVNLVNGYDMTILDDLVRVMNKINIYIWCNIAQIKSYLDYFIGKLDCSFEILIWNKTNAMPLFNNKYLSDKEYCLYFRKRGYCNPPTYQKGKTVFCLPTTQKEKKKYHHPTIKPLSIIERFIENSSRENETILDCFMGSGTTGEAVVNIGGDRKFIGMEINEEYYNTAKERIEEAIRNKEDESNEI